MSVLFPADLVMHRQNLSPFSGLFVLTNILYQKMGTTLNNDKITLLNTSIRRVHAVHLLLSGSFMFYALPYHLSLDNISLNRMVHSPFTLTMNSHLNNASLTLKVLNF